MKLKKLANRIVVVFSLVSFSATTVFALPPISEQAPVNKFETQIEIPSQLGEVSALSLPKNAEAPFFIHIQDAHANEMAQRKIKAILEFLNQNYDVKLFGIEGAHKPLKPSVLHVAQNPETNLKIAEYMVTRGWLSAGDWFAFEQYEKNKNQTDIHFEGLETASIYTRDLRLFRMGLGNRSKVDAIISRMDGNVDRLKSKNFSRDLLKFDRAYQLFKSSEHKNLLGYFKEIKRQSLEVLNLDLGNPINQMKYPQLVRLSRLADAQDTMSLDQLTREIARLKPLIYRSEPDNKDLAKLHGQILSELLKPADQMDCRPYGSWREAFESVYQVMAGHRIAWKAFPAMAQAARNLIFQEELASMEMFAEIDTLANEIENKMAKSPEETSLILLTKEMSLLKQMARLEASREEAEEVLGRKQPMLAAIESLFNSVRHEKSGLAQEDKATLETQLQIALQFYRGTKDREKAFVDHLVDYAKKYHADRLAFITGGYHTRGIREELERRGYGYMSISPRMLGENPLQGLKESSRLYEDVMTGKQKTIFSTAYIPEESNALSVADAASLGVKNRTRALRILKAMERTGTFFDMAQNVPSDNVAAGLQKVLEENEILKASGVQVVEEKDPSTKKPVLRVSLASDRRGIVVEKPAIVPQAAKAAGPGAETLGAEKKADVKFRRRANRIISTILAFTTGLLPSFMITGTLAVGAAGCAPRQSINYVLPTTTPEVSGQISNLPKNNYVNPTTGAAEPGPPVYMTVYSTPALGTTIEGDPSLLSALGVSTIVMKANYNIDKTVALPSGVNGHYSGGGISWDDFRTANTREFGDLSSFSELVIYAKGDAAQLKVTFEDVNKKLNFFVLNDVTSGGFYRIPVSMMTEIDKSKMVTMSVVVDEQTVGTKTKGSFFVAVAGVVMPPISIDVSAIPVAADSATTDLSQNQPTTQGIPVQVPTASVTGGSTIDTKVFGEKANSIILEFKHGRDEYSGMTITRNNFDDNKGAIPANIIQDDYMDLTQFPELVFNIETVSGDIPKQLNLEFKDDNGNTLVFAVKEGSFTGNKATIKVALDATQFPSTFNRSEVSLISFVSKQPIDDPTIYSGQLRVTIQGVAAAESVDVTSAGTTTDFSNQLRRPAVSSINGGNPAASVVRLNPTTIRVNYATAPGQASPTVSNEFSGVAIFSNDFKRDANGNPEPLTNEDYLDLTRFSTGTSFKMNMRATSGTIPKVLKVAFVDVNGIRQEVVVNGVTTNNSGVDIDTTKFVNPLFDRTRVMQIEVVASQPIGDTQSYSGSFDVEIQGFRAAQPISVGNPVAPATTSDFSGLTRIPVLDRGGGSSSGTSVIGETATTAIWTYQTGPNVVDAFSSALIRSENFDGQSQPGDVMNISGFGALRVNIERVSGEDPQNFVVTFVDANGLTADFSIQGYSGNSSSIVIDLSTAVNFPPGFDFASVREISFVSSQAPGDTSTHSGSARITIQGLSFLHQTAATPIAGPLNAATLATSSNFSTPVTRPAAPPRQAVISELGGASAATSVQFIDAVNKIVEIQYPSQSGSFSGFVTSTDNNDGVVQPEDLMDFTSLQALGALNFNVELMPGSTIPYRMIVEIVDQTDRRYRTQVTGLVIGTQSVSVSLAANLLPSGFDISQIRGYQVVFEPPTVPAGQPPVVQAGTARVQFRGFQASFDVSVGSAFADDQTTNFSTFGGVTAPATFSVLAGSSAPTQVNPVAGDPRNRDLVIQTSSVAGSTFSGLEIKPPAGQVYNLTGETKIDINLQQIAGAVGGLSKDLRMRFVDNVGATHDIALPVIVGTQVPGDKIGYTVFVNDTAIPVGAIDKANVVSIQIISIQESGDVIVHNATLRVTAQSLGAVKTELAPVSGPAAAIRLSFEAAHSISGSIFSSFERIKRRFPGVSRELITLIYAHQLAEAIAALEAQAPKAHVSKVEQLLQELQKASATFGQVQEGPAAVFEVADRVPTDKELAAIRADLRKDLGVFYTSLVIDGNPEQITAINAKVQAEKDFSGKSLGARFEIIPTSRETLRNVLAALPARVFKTMAKFGLKARPKSLSQLMEHTTVLADGATIEALPLVYTTNSVRITKDLQEGSSTYYSDLAVVRFLAAFFAIKSFSGLAPEIQAQLKGLYMNATDLLGQKLAQIQAEIKAVIAVMIAA